MTSPPQTQFLAIWHRALNQPGLGGLTPAMVRLWATEQGLPIDNVDERDVGPFGKTKSIVLTIRGGQACFPKVPTTGDPTWEQRRSVADQHASLWEKMEWFCPLWISNRLALNLLAEVSNCSRQRAIEIFNYHTSTIYTLPFQAVCIAQIIPQARSLREFVPLAREAYLAFYSGYRASSIAALIPVVEGSFTRIVSGIEGDLTMSEKIDRTIDRAIESTARLHFENMWVPREYLTTDYLLGQDERIFFLETFRRWLDKSFFRKTGEYNGVTWLNRHLFAHATSSSWQQSANFSRLVVAIATLCVVESWHDGTFQAPLFFPEMDEDGKLLWQQALFNAQSQMTLKLIEEKRYHQHGRLVPEMPTDDGVLLRKGILSEDCINDLVRPLRNAGWSVDVGEPDDLALYITVTAKSGEEQFGVALLYSCATDNEIYRRLAGTLNVILYRGAPYHQDQFAYGVGIHVGPVSAWQPPLAPTRMGN